jgi:hypothetical protein
MYGVYGKLAEYKYVCYSTHSPTKTVLCGAPQGSKLGPLLFLIYVNDVHLSTNLEVLTFADDTTAYISNNNIQSLYCETNEELHTRYIV